jgi:hypothetical protein
VRFDNLLQIKTSVWREIMKLLQLFLLVIFSFGCGIYVGHIFKFDSNPISPITPEWIHNQTPDPDMFKIVNKGVEKYSKDHQSISNFIVHSDSNTGLIETDWYTDHKGEIKLKAQICVWGKNYRVDVWQRLLITGEIKKTYWSRMSEKEFQNTIEELRKVI